MQDFQISTLVQCFPPVNYVAPPSRTHTLSFSKPKRKKQRENATAPPKGHLKAIKTKQRLKSGKDFSCCPRYSVQDCYYRCSLTDGALWGSLWSGYILALHPVWKIGQNRSKTQNRSFCKIRTPLNELKWFTDLNVGGKTGLKPLEENTRVNPPSLGLGMVPKTGCQKHEQQKEKQIIGLQ